MRELVGLNWNDLKFFYIVSIYGTLAEASEKLKVNHSTVFRRINALEDVLGAKLFDRTPDGYQLSAVGAEAQRHVEIIADSIGGIHSLLDNHINQLRGVINLTAPHNFAYRYLPKIIQSFREKYPDIQINLLVTNKDCDLSRREADLAVRATPAPPEHLIGTKLFSFRWSVYGSESYLEKHGRPEGINQLVDHSIISAHDELDFLPAFRWIHRNISDNNVVSRCNDLVSISELAAAGVGLAILPDDQNKPSLVKLFEVDFAESSDIWLLSHPNLRDCLRLRTFKAYLIECFNQDVDLQANRVCGESSSN